MLVKLSVVPLKGHRWPCTPKTRQTMCSPPLTLSEFSSSAYFVYSAVRMPLRSPQLCGEPMANAPECTPMLADFTSINPVSDACTVSHALARHFFNFVSLRALSGLFIFYARLRKVLQGYASQKNLHPRFTFHRSGRFHRPAAPRGDPAQSGPVRPSNFFIFMEPCAANTSHQITPLNTPLTPASRAGRAFNSLRVALTMDTVRHAPTRQHC